MYTASNHSPFMGLMTTVMSLLMFVVSANAACNPIPTMTEFPGSDNITLSQQYDIEFLPGGGSDTCGPTVFKCENSSLSLVLKSLTIKTKKMITFKQFIVVDHGVDIMFFGGWNIPRSYGADNFVYTYTPDIVIVTNGSLGVETTVVISSKFPIDSPNETTVEILFQCLEIDPPAIPAPVPHDEYAKLTSRFQVYVLPVVILFLLLMVGIIHRCNPYATVKLKSWGGFGEMDDEEIKNHAGGGTWLDNVDDIVTDLRSRGVHETRADKEEEMKGMGDRDDSVSNKSSGSGSDDENNRSTSDLFDIQVMRNQITEIKKQQKTTDGEASDDVESVESGGDNSVDDDDDL